MRILMGKGVLSWAPQERRSDRYGAVFLMEEETNSFSKEQAPVELLNQPASLQKGKLIAVVKKTRQSTHVGDWFHSVFPSTSIIGEEIILGCGSLFYDECKYGYQHVGLEPEDGRKSLWLDIHSLYKAHEQSVELYFELDEEGEKK